MTPMTERHVAYLAGFAKTLEDERQGHQVVTEILSVIQGLADGSLRCADTRTHVFVSRGELERMRDMFVDLAADPNTATTIAYKDVRRWLSTPEQPATETP